MAEYFIAIFLSVLSKWKLNPTLLFNRSDRLNQQNRVNYLYFILIFFSSAQKSPVFYETLFHYI